MSAATVDTAVAAATQAFPAYRTMPRERIAGFLSAIGAAITALGDDLVQTAHAETALPEARLVGERGRTVGQLELFARTVTEGSWVRARIDRAQPDRKPAPRPDLRSMLVPMGPVAVFGSSNFPLAFSTAGGDTASALAAGCPVIVKAHSAHPRTSDLVARAVASAAAATGMPAGVFSHIQVGHAEGLALVRHPGIKAVGFTGSQRAGRALFDAAAARPDPVPVFAEMSSVNPVVILPSALDGDLAALAGGLCASVALGVGQFCTNPGLVFMLEGPRTEGFLFALAARIAEVPPAPMLTPAIRAAYQAGVDRLDVRPGVVVTGKSRSPADAARREAGAIALTVSGAAFLADPTLADEVFGPSTLVVVCRNPAELEDAVASLPGQLTATVHGSPADIEAQSRLVDLLRERAGRLLFGGFPTGVEVVDAQQHGGPWPASSDSRFTSVGTAAILRWVRPVAYQGFPDGLLPGALKNENPLNLLRLVDAQWTRDPVG